MATVFVKHCAENAVLHGVYAGDIVTQLGYGEDNIDVYLTCNGKRIAVQDCIQDGNVYHVIPRVLGGKGGFGSMLRAIGAQIEKTTNREACRDLSGRRMRDVNNEKQLRDWVAKAADREREKERKRRERMERRKAEPLHKFEDPTYHQQTAKVAENLDDALQQGLAQAKKPSTSGLSTRKRKAPEATVTRAKKTCDWMGVDVENLSDLDSDSDPENVAEPQPGTPPAKDSGNPSPQSYQQESEDNSDSGVESVSVPTIKKCMETMDIDSASSSEGQKEDITPRDSDCSSMEVGSVQEIDSDTPSCTAPVDGSNALPPVVGSLSRNASTLPEGAPTVLNNSEDAAKKHGMLDALAQIPPADSRPSCEALKQDYKDVDLMSLSSVEDLEALGLDHLKVMLSVRGLKCGGTLQQRAERLWAVRGLSQDQIDPSMFAGKNKGKSKKK